MLCPRCINGGRCEDIVRTSGRVRTTEDRLAIRARELSRLRHHPPGVRCGHESCVPAPARGRPTRGIFGRRPERFPDRSRIIGLDPPHQLSRDATHRHPTRTHRSALAIDRVYRVCTPILRRRNVGAILAPVARDYRDGWIVIANLHHHNVRVGQPDLNSPRSNIHGVSLTSRIMREES